MKRESYPRIREQRGLIEEEVPNGFVPLSGITAGELRKQPIENFEH